MDASTGATDYVAAGYYLSRYAGTRDCTGTELRKVSVAHDHSSRRFFPSDWALSWCRAVPEDRLEGAATFGIAAADLAGVIEWADKNFDQAFGVYDVIYSLDDAQKIARSFLGNAKELELWGLGLHRSLLADFCTATAPPASPPGHAPIGPSGAHVAACMHSQPLAPGGTALGFEVLIHEECCFNSPESRHLDEAAAFRAADVVPNEHGLLSSFEDALRCCEQLDATAGETQHRITGWLPWLLVSYPV